MAFTRRRLIIGGTAAAAAGVLTPVIVAQKKRAVAPLPPAGLSEWDSVRAQFNVDPDLIHLGLFYIASNPRPVREAIEAYRRLLDADPYHTVEQGMFGPAGVNLTGRATAAIASYIGAHADDIALTQNTTTGLAIIYQGLPLRPGDEILTTTHDHMVHHEAIRLACERSGASWRKIRLFDSTAGISVADIVNRIRREIRPATRVVGVTWVHSSTGLKLPLREIASAIAVANTSRSENDRVLLFVDGVHGLGVEDPLVAQSGIDGFAAGTHKWLFGPRGTGFAWARPGVWSRMRPLMPTFSAPELYTAWARGSAPDEVPRAAWFTPGGFWAFEHYWALPAAFEFHKAIGPQRITERIHALNGSFRRELARMPRVTMYTPLPSDLAAGIVTFDVSGLRQTQVVARLLEKKIVASTTPYPVSYARVAFGIHNSEADVEATLRAVRDLT